MKITLSFILDRVFLLVKYISVAYFASLLTFYALSQIQAKNPQDKFLGSLIETHQDTVLDSSSKSLLGWTKKLISGNLESEYFNSPILLFGDAGDSHQPVIIPIISRTIIQCSVSIIVAWILALGLYLSILSNSLAIWFLASTFKKIFNFITSFHIILIALFLRVMFNEMVPWYLITASIILGSNVFYDISSDLSNHLDEIFASDYYLMSRATGGQPWRHVLRPIASIAIIQIFSMWPIVLTNTIIIEIILQVDGIGSLIFQHIIEPLSNGIQIDQNFLIAILTISIIVVSVIAFIRDVMIDRISKLRA
jgi:ABC-type dipeptide/oligopeptide/nickel transport system permease component